MVHSSVVSHPMVLTCTVVWCPDQLCIGIIVHGNPAFSQSLGKLDLSQNLHVVHVSGYM